MFPNDPAAPQVLACIAAPAGSRLPLPRLLVVLAHPDDEVLALGARLERLSASRLLTVTDGAPTDGADAHHHGFPTLDAYRSARRAELAQALAHAGLPPDIAQPLALQVPDQTASLHLAALTRALAAAIAAFAPEAVLTHPYEGGHPDHDATAFAVHTALKLLDPNHPRPVLIEAPFYNAAPDGSLRTHTFLPPKPGSQTPSEPLTCRLTPNEQSNKQARLACFPTQAETLAQFLTDRELFRLAPSYDFTQPPHPGRLFYDHFPWGMTGDRFRTLAAEAQAELLSTRPRQVA